MAAILLLLFMVLISLVSMLNLYYYYYYYLKCANIVIISFYVDVVSSLKRLNSSLWEAITDSEVETKIK